MRLSPGGRRSRREAAMAGSPVPSLPQRVLAAELKRRRRAAGLSREQVAAALEWSGMKPWRIEEARVRVGLCRGRPRAGQAVRPGRQGHRGAGRAGPPGTPPLRLVEGHGARPARGLRRAPGAGGHRGGDPQLRGAARARPVADRGLRPRGPSAPTAFPPAPRRSSSGSGSGCAASSCGTGSIPRPRPCGPSWTRPSSDARPAAGTSCAASWSGCARPPPGRT